jgi:PERQ amino acid-rich with GYF domain-containing protein
MPFTPSFDGVLNSGDSWVSRRRASEGLQKSAVVKGDAGGGEGQQDGKEADIKEEEEEEGRKETDRNPIISDGSSSVHRPESPPQPEPSRSPPSDPPPSKSPEVQVASSGSRKVSSTAETSVGIISAVNTAPPLQDLTSVEWSYLDPQGQVQGQATNKSNLSLD